MEYDIQGVFMSDRISEVVTSAVDGVLASKEYDPQHAKKWTAQCLDQIVKELADSQQAFKYVVNCAIMQKTGAGLHTGMSCYWDNSTDGSQTVRWENKTMYCLCTVFGVTF